jgi:ribosomal protein L13E
MDIDPKIENDITTYPFNERSYLDPQFLTTMGDKDDRGLAAEGLRLLQLDVDMRSLNKWEQHLTKLETFIHQERIEFMERKTSLQKTKDDVHQ